jgi:transcriptional regulator with XRE-family HTH domain
MSETKYKKQEVPPEFHKMHAFIGSILRQYRWEENLTLKEAQEQSGIHHRTISRIENGKPISLVTLFRYMKFLDLDMPDIAFTYEEIE